MAKKNKDSEKSDRRSLNEVEELINSGDGLDLSDEDRAFLQGQVKSAKERSKGGTPSALRELQKARPGRPIMIKPGSSQYVVVASELKPRPMHSVFEQVRKGDNGSYSFEEWVTCRAYKLKNGELQPTGKSCPLCTLMGPPEQPMILWVVSEDWENQNKKSKNFGEITKSPLNFLCSTDTYNIAQLMSIRNESGPKVVVKNKAGKAKLDADGNKVKKRVLTGMVFGITRQKRNNSDKFGQWRYIGTFGKESDNKTMGKVHRRRKTIAKRLDSIPKHALAFPVPSEDDMIALGENHVAVADTIEKSYRYNEIGLKRFERRDWSLDHSNDDDDSDDDDDDDELGDDPLEGLFDGKKSDKKGKKKKSKKK